MLTCVILAGCGGGEGERPTVPVVGQAFFQSQPASGAMVVLLPTEDASPETWPQGFPRAIVAEDGSFQVGTYKDNDGAPAGDYKVTVAWLVPAPNSSPEDSEPDLVDRLNGRYSDPERSAWLVKVEAPRAEVQRLELN
jgi:hypothetical protein